MKEEENNNNSDFGIKMKTITCQKCKAIVIAYENWIELICPICLEINKLPQLQVMRPNIDIDAHLKNVVQYIKVTCSFCSHKMNTKRESDYLICSKCKNSVIIIKDEQFPYGLDPMIFKKYKAREIFNPYQRHLEDPFHLDHGFEHEMVQKIKTEMNIRRNNKEIINNEINKSPINKYKSLMQTIKDINNNISNLDYYKTPQPKKQSKVIRNNGK